MTFRSCSWCHHSNPATERFCENCHHEGHVARLDCGCPRCDRLRQAVVARDTPAPFANAVDEAIAEMQERVAEQDAEQA